jgi:hypothetical protein
MMWLLSLHVCVQPISAWRVDAAAFVALVYSAMVNFVISSIRRLA